MTELRDEASVLPLSVTCAPDGRFAEALHAVVGRVGALTGDISRAQPFVERVQEVLAWAFAHPDGIAGDIALRFAREGDSLQGDLRWAASGTTADVPGPVATPDVQVRCDVDGTQVHCRVSCRCA